MTSLFADVGGRRLGNWSTGNDIGDFAIIIVILAAVLAIVMLALKHFEVEVPPVVWKVLWIVLGAILFIWAIRFIMTM